MTCSKEHMVLNHQLVFIGGLHRSGTSLLHQCLRDHPQIAALRDTGVPEDEGQHLQSVYLPAARLGGPGVFGFAPQAHLTEDSPLINDENRRRLFDAWALHWDLSRPILLEKTPQNLLQTRFLQAMFPQARFIMLTRHPVAVSYATRKWCHASLYDLVDHWRQCHELFSADSVHLRSVMQLRYEDLVIHPEEWLPRVYDFLGLLPCHSPVKIHPDVNEKYFRRWRAARTGLVSGPYINHVVRQFEERVALRGYSLERLTDAEPRAPLAPL